MLITSASSSTASAIRSNVTCSISFPTLTSPLSPMPMISPSLIALPSIDVSLTEYVTCPLFTFFTAAFMDDLFSWTSTVLSNAIIALIPCGAFAVGTTIIFLSSHRVAAWFAASTTFLLFGSINIFSALTTSMALSISSVLGFIV